MTGADIGGPGGGAAEGISSSNRGQSLPRAGGDARDREASLSTAELFLRIDPPGDEEVRPLPEGSVHISYMDPFNNPGRVGELAARWISAISLEMIPRTTIAQKMDVPSSQANLAGYVAVILAAERQRKIFPMMMTPAGTIPPARVFVIGAGVAGRMPGDMNVLLAEANVPCEQLVGPLQTCICGRPDNQGLCPRTPEICRFSPIAW